MIAPQWLEIESVKETNTPPNRPGPIYFEEKLYYNLSYFVYVCIDSFYVFCTHFFHSPLLNVTLFLLFIPTIFHLKISLFHFKKNRRVVYILIKQSLIEPINCFYFSQLMLR